MEYLMCIWYNNTTYHDQVSFKTVRTHDEKIYQARKYTKLLVYQCIMDDKAIIKDRQNRDNRLENTSLQHNFTPFKMPFWVFDQSLFESGRDLDYFALDMNMGTMDDLLQIVFAEEGTIELNETSFGTLIPGQILDSNIIYLCLKW